MGLLSNYKRDMHMEDSRPHHPNVQETRNLEVLIGTVGAVHPLPLLYSTVIQKEK
jgi:hypothetical protein